MKRKSNNKTNKALTITLLTTSIIMTALVVWIGLNGWDVTKTLKQVGIGIEGEPQETPLETPDAVEEQEKVPKENDVTNETETEGQKDTETTTPTKEQQKPVTPAPKEEDKAQVTNKPPVNKNKSGYIEGQELPKEPTYINGILLANKQYPLPSTFAPGENTEARDAFDEMAAEAKLSGFNITAFSTYRSYEYQVSLYDRYAKKDGVEAADRYSARPGYSEHQTGLAFDIGEVNYEKHWASSSFGDTEAGKWVAANAHRYGFILRYPEGKEAITGYMHESWHFRYVGKPASEEIFKRNITLEEYLGVQ